MLRNQDIDIKQLALAIVLFLILIIISFTGGVLASRYLPLFSSIHEYQELNQSISLLKQHYYGDLPDSTRLEYGMIRGMLRELDDPHTVFIEPVQSELQSNQLQGSFGGIGCRLEWDADGNMLLYPFPGSAAETAGIQNGDRLIQAEDLIITPDLTLEEIQAAIRGEVGSRVELTIARAPEYAEIVVKVTREEVSLPSTTWNLAPQDARVGIIQVNLMAASTPEEIQSAIADLQSQGAGFFVLDLRNNSGGLLEAGIETARLFVGEGILLEEQYRGQPAEQVTHENAGPYVDLPLAVLINHNSASAAEIVAGVLQGRQRARLIGVNSYGKDTIQFVFDLNDGSSLHVTTAQWWIPDLGYDIHGTGLVPDVNLSDEDANSAAAVEAAIKDLLE